ncbi:hypothetical protein GCM10011571_11500 [Marinithermofilum abyssi]|uniref:MYXO-CTERM domain-containing protein n=1 Tax=Marinithermofilum abyssi TaxID=1571185 RepID=A0A8J2VDI8_9BACL|nr:WGxxGxxG family protein [Marinithermofilum abyssi]GGE11808.1 hypothetical protein GCM10011571_11500 [Marinithermofilum abyssi]
MAGNQQKEPMHYDEVFSVWKCVRFTQKWIVSITVALILSLGIQAFHMYPQAVAAIDVDRNGPMNNNRSDRILNQKRQQYYNYNERNVSNTVDAGINNNDTNWEWIGLLGLLGLLGLRRRPVKPQK